MSPFWRKKISEFAPEATYRLGLSATPFSSDEEDYDSPFPDVAKERILKYFNSIVARYTLEDAIVEGVLCNYNYHIIETYLTEEEQEEYDELSREIGILVAIDANNGLNENQRSKLSMLTGRRAMLLGNAENKYSALAQLTKNIPKEFRPLSLFYCGAGHDRNSTEVDYNDTNLIRVIDRVSQILVQNGWTTSQFTSRESTVERKSRMENFTQQHIDALVTIRVLDEGVDVPACQSAFLLASTKNKRQYVQRRGRVLRKYEGKDIAEIYDFVVLPHPTMGSQYGRRLIDSELERIDEFSSLALNKLDISNKIKNLGLRHIKGKYD